MKLILGLLSLFGFGVLSAGEKEKTDESAFSFNFVCLQKLVKPTEEDCEEAFRKAFHLDQDDPLEIEVEANKKEGKELLSITATFEDESSVIAMQAGFPVPWDDLEYACYNSYFWPTADKDLKKSRDHFIVVVTNPEADKVKKVLHLSRGLLAIANSTKAMGIYNGDATTVYKRDYYEKMLPEKIESVEDVPAILWVGFLKAIHRDETVSFYTRGLAEFGCKEVEVVRSKKEGMEIFSLVHGISQYLISAGDVIEDGNTVGGTDDEKIKVYHKKSKLDGRGTVLRIDF